MPILCALVGATGVGKTRLSLSLAQNLNAEIISMDSRQLYSGFCIGTAQPSPEEQGLVKHHLVNFLSPALTYSAGDFVKDVRELLARNPRRDFVLVGGTGLYLKALVEGLAEIPTVSAEIRERCESFLEKEGLASLYKEVETVDPEAAASILPQDRQRLLRAMEVSLQTGRKFSEIRKERRGGLGAVKTFWLDRERTTLYERIDSRVDAMIESGWIDEVVNLYAKVPLDAPAWQSLGYREWVSYIKGEMSRENVLDLVKMGSRRYAKRQITWFRHQNESEKVDLDGSFEENLEKICRQVAPGLRKV